MLWQERQRKLAEEQRNLVQQKAQARAQGLRNEDELARKRLQVHELTLCICLLQIGLKNLPVVERSHQIAEALVVN